MELDPIEIGRIARRWDEQHLELVAAGHQIGGASGRGFSPAVEDAASRFASRWARAAAALGEACETRADSMRSSVRLALGADGVSGATLARLRPGIAENR